MAEDLAIAIDRNACRGAGECVYRAGRTFALDDAGRAVVVDSDRREKGDDEPVVLEAARACPHFAISVSRGGSQIV